MCAYSQARAATVVFVAAAVQELLSARAKGATRLKPLLLDQVSLAAQQNSPPRQSCTGTLRAMAAYGVMQDMLLGSN
jgi:hypothetical protein